MDRVEVVEHQVALLELADSQVGLLRKLGMVLVSALQGPHLVTVEKWRFLADVLFVDGGEELGVCDPALEHNFLVRRDLFLRRLHLDRLGILQSHLVDKLVAYTGLLRPRGVKEDSTARRFVHFLRKGTSRLGTDGAGFA